MRKIPVLVVLAGLIFAAVAAGDTVYKRNGHKLVGNVTDKGDKYIIRMPNGTFSIDKSDVSYVAYGAGATAPASAPATLPSDYKPINPGVSRAGYWDINDATLPDPIVFMLSRRIELLGQVATDTMRTQLRQWKIAAHDGKRKLGKKWLTRDQQRRYRAYFEEHIRQGDKFARQADGVSMQTGSDRAKKKKLFASAEREYATAVRSWPDADMREFFTAILNLRNRKYEEAQNDFARCILKKPLVAAFRQGRGIALSKLKQPLAALTEFTFCLQLRDDDYETIRLVEAAMKDVPGSKLADPAYLKARDLLDRYEKPQRNNHGRNTGVVWLMPGSSWRQQWHRQSRGTGDNHKNEQLPDTRFALPLAPYDRIINKQALAIPVSETALLVDKNAIAGAEILYVQVAPDVLIRAWANRSIRRSGRRKTPDLPLAIIHTEGVIFSPVNVEKTADLKAGQALTVRGVNLYRQMGTKIRNGIATVTPTGTTTTQSGSQKDGITLSAGLLPGETVGAAMAGDTFAGLLTARTSPQEEGCGKSTFITPAEIAAWIKPIKRSLDRKTSGKSSRGRGPVKKDTPELTVTGKVFLVHILFCEKPPSSEVIKK
ncbi:MAG: hypothetical protein SVV80_00250 [Planctomycetota bacterium]|nr:hypothetical protein [Planctomycetota bacterium]